MWASSQSRPRHDDQTPSKVLLLRNLPRNCSEEELVELCRPFGQVVNAVCNVGAYCKHAFVEFARISPAISMVSFYASSSEPPRIRGKNVYIQYSNRYEMVDNKRPGDKPGKVLLVTFEGVGAGDMSIDVIHVVFSAFGFVQKISTFEKVAGFQALIQFSDAETASAARDALDGRSIPGYLLPEHVTSCHLRISFSAQTDLNIKFQSRRSRDYTKQHQLANPTAMEGHLAPVDGRSGQAPSNVLLAAIHNMQYPVTMDVLHTVFSAYGIVLKIAMFEKNGMTQAFIQYPDVATAAFAKEALEGRCIYDGGYCRLHLLYSRHTDLIIKIHIMVVAREADLLWVSVRFSRPQFLLSCIFQPCSDKNRDYTIPDLSSLVAHRIPALSGDPAIGPGRQTASPYPCPAYSATQFPRGQVPPHPSVPGAFQGQTCASPSVPTYHSGSFSSFSVSVPGEGPAPTAQPGVAAAQVPGGFQGNAGALSGWPPAAYYGQ